MDGQQVIKWKVGDEWARAGQGGEKGSDYHFVGSRGLVTYYCVGSKKS